MEAMTGLDRPLFDNRRMEATCQKIKIRNYPLSPYRHHIHVRRAPAATLHERLVHTGFIATSAWSVITLKG